jgi:RNA polymerase sigma factor (sigma-70 family)
MAGTRYNTRSRGGEFFAGDMAAYMRAGAENNEADICRLRRNLGLARRSELTPRQAQLVDMYFDEGLSMAEIGARLGISKSTVSRTLSRAKLRLRRSLKYGL